jgi:hypothetical protein
MSAVDFEAVARVLDGLADALETDRGLNPDQALRRAVWGDADKAYPGDHAPGADLFDEAHTALEAATESQGAGIERVPRDEAVVAARAEAVRYRTCGGGR